MNEYSFLELIENVYGQVSHTRRQTNQHIIINLLIAWACLNMLLSRILNEMF